MVIGHTLWKGNIGIGLFTFPVRIASVSNKSGVQLHYSHDEDSGKLTQKYFCKKCGNEVSYGEMGRWTKVDSGKEVFLSYDDIKSANPDSSKKIDIIKITDADNIPSKMWLHLDKTYPILNDETNSDGKALKVFWQSMKEINAVAIGTIVLRKTGNEKVALIVANNEGLLLHTLSYANEIKHSLLEEAKSFLDTIEVTKDEIELGKNLLNSLKGGFSWGDYSQIKDEKASLINNLIAQKTEGVVIEPTKEKKEKKNNDPLFEQLRKAVVEARKGEEKNH